MRKRPANRGFSACLMAGLFLVGLSGAQAQPVPKRVVSINVCTDQLAMVLAQDGQLRSVSNLARDPLMSVMADKADRLPVNRAQAEEVFLLQPDLVLAGTFSSRATVGLLRQLGVRVEEFAPARNFEDIMAHMERMGTLLGREDEARKQIAAMKTALAAIRKPAHRRTVALYYANSYTAGRGTLIDDAVRRAGLDNLTEKLGIRGSATLPLELLVVEKPDMIVRSSRGQAPALAFENFQHPALHALGTEARMISLADNLTVCGGPFSVEAVAQLAEAARE
ncbi:ABC transporter substrate-binding protein [Falsochrobactrum shanghaiense]|uniref:ABC transporter substrate-binding protein n=1 Tax=Falsochrobactrum shanghaiense TaxID=2201899 RepID=A0A316J6K4_9HYPH|nr:ABC transporter substrate-binding protein [Falsochrobactrum shanghaiense]